MDLRPNASVPTVLLLHESAFSMQLVFSHGHHVMARRGIGSFARFQLNPTRPKSVSTNVPFSCNDKINNNWLRQHHKLLICIAMLFH